MFLSAKLLGEPTIKNIIKGFVLVLLFIPQVFAEQSTFDQSAQVGDEEVIEKGKPVIVDDGINGLVVDQTITVIGRSFYQAFSDAWRDVKDSNDVNVTVNERPSARTGSLVTIEVDRKVVFRRFLPPARANIVSAANQAIAAAARNAKKNKLDKLFRNPDLGADEI